VSFGQPRSVLRHDIQASFKPVREELVESRDIGVKAISNKGFRLVDGTFLHGPVALFPKVALSWRVGEITSTGYPIAQVPTPHDIDADSLHLLTLFEPRLDIVLLGCGELNQVDAIRRRCMPFFREHKIPVEIMASVGDVLRCSEASIVGGRGALVQLLEQGAPVRGRADVPARAAAGEPPRALRRPLGDAGLQRGVHQFS